MFLKGEVEKEKTEHRPKKHQQVAPPDHPDDVVHVQGVEREEQRDDLGEIGILGLSLQEIKKENQPEEVDQQIRQAQGDILDPPEFVFQKKRSREQGTIIVVLSLDAELLAEIAEFEGRADRMILNKEDVVLEIHLIIPDQIIVERLPVDSEEDNDQGEQENQVFLQHAATPLSVRDGDDEEILFTDSISIGTAHYRKTQPARQSCLAGICYNPPP